MNKKVKARMGKRGFNVCLYDIERVLEHNEIVKDLRVRLDSDIGSQKSLYIKGLKELEAVQELLGLVRGFIPDDGKIDVHKSSIDGVVSVGFDKEVCKYRQDVNVKYARDWLLKNYVNSLNIYSSYIPYNLGYC